MSIQLPIEERVQPIVHIVYHATSDKQQPMRVQIDGIVPKVGLVLTSFAVCHLVD